MKLTFPDIDECASTPCENDATCEDGVNSYTCKCKAGFTGKNCEESEFWEKKICLIRSVMKFYENQEDFYQIYKCSRLHEIFCVFPMGLLLTGLRIPFTQRRQCLKTERNSYVEGLRSYDTSMKKM